MFCPVFLAERQNSLFNCSQKIHTFFGAFFFYSNKAAKDIDVYADASRKIPPVVSVIQYSTGSKFHLRFLVRFLPNVNTK